jgi:hypothetical protein
LGFNIAKEEEGYEMHVVDELIDVRKLLGSPNMNFDKEIARHEALVELGGPGQLSSFAIPSSEKYLDVPTPEETEKKSKERYQKLLDSLY